MRWGTLTLMVVAVGCGSLTGAVAAELRGVVPVIPSDVPTRMIEQPEAEAEAEPEAEATMEEEPEMPWPSMEEIEEGLLYEEMLFA